MMKYLYFKLYQAFYNAKSKDTSAMNAMFIISVLEFINITTLLLLLRHYFDSSFIFYSRNEIIIFVSICTVISYIINYFILYKNLGEITKKYKQESKLKSILGLIGLIGYIFGSCYLAYLVGSAFPIGQ